MDTIIYIVSMVIICIYNTRTIHEYSEEVRRLRNELINLGAYDKVFPEEMRDNNGNN